jgi:exoribonuclease II
MSSYFKKASNPHGSLRYAQQMLCGYLEGRERSYMVLDSLYEVEECFGKKLLDGDAIRAALHSENEDEEARAKVLAEAIFTIRKRLG